MTEVGDGPDKACCGKEVPDGEGPVSKDGGGTSCGFDGDVTEKVPERSKSLAEKEEFRNTPRQGETVAESWVEDTALEMFYEIAGGGDFRKLAES